MRLFIAINPPPAVCASLAAAGQDLAVSLGPLVPGGRLRPLAVDQIHLTLAFLGEVAPARLPELTGLIAAVAGRHAGFGLQTGRPGCFSGVVWLGLHDQPDLSRLQAALEHALLAAGFLPRAGQRQAYRPHLTLVRSSRPLEAPGHPAALPPDLPVQAFRAGEICLMQSETGPRGSRYLQLGAWPLAGQVIE